MNDDDTDTRAITGDLSPPGGESPRAEQRPAAARPSRPQPIAFPRSEAYLAGQIARAVARGQRVL